MTRQEKQNYLNMETIAYYSICNWGGISVKGIEYGINDYMIVSWDDNTDCHRVKINYTNSGRDYIRLGNTRYYLDGFMWVQ